MENDKNNIFGDAINDAIDDIKTYVDLRMQLIQLNISEKIAVALAKMITTGAALVLLLLFFLFGSLALAFFLGNCLNNTAAGFAILAGFYLLLAIIMMSFGKNKLRIKLINAFIKQFNNDQD